MYPLYLTLHEILRSRFQNQKSHLIMFVFVNNGCTELREKVPRISQIDRTGRTASQRILQSRIGLRAFTQPGVRPFTEPCSVHLLGCLCSGSISFLLCYLLHLYCITTTEGTINITSLSPLSQFSTPPPHSVIYSYTDTHSNEPRNITRPTPSRIFASVKVRQDKDNLSKRSFIISPVFRNHNSKAISCLNISNQYP